MRKIRRRFSNVRVQDKQISLDNQFLWQSIQHYFQRLLKRCLYRVFYGFRLNLGKCSNIPIFWSLLTTFDANCFIEEDVEVGKIGSCLKTDNHTQVTCVKISGTHCIRILTTKSNSACSVAILALDFLQTFFEFYFDKEFGNSLCFHFMFC